MNPLFEGIAANDAKDLVNFIIMTLLKELNKNKDNPSFKPSFMDQTNPQINYRNFMEGFKFKNYSIISQLFYATNCNIIQCNKCQKYLFNYQIYFFLTFLLEEVHKYKINNPINNYY